MGRCFEHELSRGLDSPDCYFNSISTELRPKRDRIIKLLIEAGLTPVIPEGGYFIMADISNIAKDFKSDENEYKDSKFVKYLIKEKVILTLVFMHFKIIFLIIIKGSSYNSHNSFLQ